MWTWDVGKGIYVLDGMTAGRDLVTGLLTKSSLYTRAALIDVATQLQAGTLSAYSAEAQMRTILKSEFIRQYLAGIGGRTQATFRDWGTLGAMLKKQYGFLSGFVRDAKNMSAAKLEQHLNYYAQSGDLAYARAKGKTAIRVGYSMVRWNLDAGTKDHCNTCLQRAGMSFVETGPHGGFVDATGLECWPRDGTSECFANDRCKLTYLNSSGDEYEL